VIVVSDTSVVTALLQLGQIEILRSLYGEVILPKAVQHELLRSHNSLPSFLVVQSAADREMVRSLEEILDRGESEAIAISLELSADALLMDELKGREEARARGLRVVGLLGVLVQARRAGLVPLLSPLLQQLRHEVGFYISDQLEADVLKVVGE